jgi:hypothetical protein
VDFDRRTVLVLSFVLLSLGSAIYVSVAAVNYLLLYPALDQIGAEQSYQVSHLSLIQSQPSNRSSLIVGTVVSNPTGYYGLSLSSVAVTLYFSAQSDPNSTIFQTTSGELSASETVNSLLGPSSTDSVSLQVPLTSNQTSTLISFYNQFNGRIVGNINLRVDIATFLLSVTGTDAYTRTQQVSLLMN